MIPGISVLWKRLAAGSAVGVVAFAIAALGSMPAYAVTPGKGPAKRLSHTGPAPGAMHFASPVTAKTAAGVAVSPATSLTPPLAVRGTDQALWVYTSSGWTDYGGTLSADPAVVVVPPATAGGQTETLYVVSGSNHVLWIRSDTSGWQKLAPFPTYAIQGPSAVVSGTAGNYTLTVAYEGSDTGLWAGTVPVNAAALPSLTTNSYLGGQMRGQPAVLIENGVPTYYMTGLDSDVYYRTNSQGWTQFPSFQCFGHPVAGQASSGFQLLSCWGLDNGLWYSSRSTGGWSTAADAGGILTEDLAVRGLTTDVAIDNGGSSNSVYETAVGPGGIEGWRKLAISYDPTTQGDYELSWVPVYAQQMALDCEAASQQMALAGLGHYYSQSSLVSWEQPDNRLPYWQSGTMRWSNPYLHFVGNPNGSEPALTGWGIFYPLIVSIAQSHGAPHTYGGQGYTPLDIYQQLAAGHPVQVWVEYDWVRPQMGWWLTYNGSNWIHYSTWEHSVLLVGLSPDDVEINDPGHGDRYWIPRSTFTTSWGDYSDMAVIYSS